MAKRTLKDEEAALWRAVMHDVAPLRTPRIRPKSHSKSSGKRKIVPPLSPEVTFSSEVTSNEFQVAMASPVLRAAPLRRPSPKPTDVRIGVRSPGLDDTQWRRLSRGKIPVDARLDLHGYIVQEAFEEFVGFMRRGRGMGWRCVEIVTGLGSGQRSGMIRRELPLWLQRRDIQPMVLGVVHSHKGNQGAVRLLLRKKR